MNKPPLSKKDTGRIHDSIKDSLQGFDSLELSETNAAMAKFGGKIGQQADPRKKDEDRFSSHLRGAEEEEIKEEFGNT